MDVTGKTKVYRRDFDGRPSYSRAISSREYKDGQQGDWMTVYEPMQMPRGTNIPDRSIIEITKAFEAVYRSKDGIKKKLVVQEFNVLDAGREEPAEEAPEGYAALTDEDIPF